MAIDIAALRRQGADALRRWSGRAQETTGARERVLVAASFTAQPIEAALGVTLADAGTDVAVEFADYNQIFQLCLQPERHGIGAGSDVVVMWRIEDVFERDFHAAMNGDAAALSALVDGARSLGAALAGLVERTGCRLVVGDAPVPCGFGLDHDDDTEMAELLSMQRVANDAFDGALGDAPVLRLRLGAMQTAYGSHATFDARSWLLYRQPWTGWFAHLVGERVARLIIGRTAAPPKVLVLDCDNTLWGGVAGDDGVEALVCGDAFPGFAYQGLQRAAQRLRHRGVLLALVSKNDPQTVVEAFAEVDGMVLTDDDIAGRRVSWGPKAEGIAELAGELNLGLDSFVFVDDSDFEVASVAAELPTVRTLRVPDDLEDVPDVLAASGLFRRLRVTADDRERTARIRTEAQRTGAAASMSHDEFLASLALRARVTEVGAGDPALARVTQLVNKTNQFNLTTRRRSAEEIAEVAASDVHRLFTVTVDDRFGEYGIVGVAIAEATPAGWHLDTLLMSCRVLGRGVETAFLAGVTAALRVSSPAAISGTYVPTAKNAAVAGLYAAHGFEAGGGGTWTLPADRSVDAPAHISTGR